MYQFIPIHACDDLKKISIKINVVTDEDNSQNEIKYIHIKKKLILTYI